MGRVHKQHTFVTLELNFGWKCGLLALGYLKSCDGPWKDIGQQMNKVTKKHDIKVKMNTFWGPLFGLIS